VHILLIFASMTLALRTGLAALTGGAVRGLAWATIASLVAGAFVLGPLVQWYAFGVWWSGVPFGYDWTDNKVLVELVAWLGAAAVILRARDPRRARTAVLAATLVTLAVYFIPHSVFGSEYDYTRGAGHGTAG
jgi:small-conductance mechanosensitive channel